MSTPASASTMTVAEKFADVEFASSKEVPVTTVNEEPEFPEGGLQAWLAVAGSFLVYFASFGVINSFGTFQNFYETEYLSNYTSTVIAFIGALQITILYVEGLFIGSLFDSFGLKWLYLIGCAGSVLSTIALSFTRPQAIWQQFLSQGVLFGLAVGFGFQPALCVVGHYFRRRRALAMGIVAAGSSVGGVCLPIMFSRLFDRIGFAWTVRVAALITLVCYTIAILITRERLPHKPLKSVRDLIDFDGFRDRRYALFAAGSFLVNLGLYSPYFYLEPFAKAYGVSDHVHPYLLSIVNGTSFFGRILGGQAADRYGRMNVLVPSTALSGILCLAFWLPSRGAVPLVLFACLYGFFSGIFISVAPAAVGQMSPTDRLGARIGTFFLPVALATLLGTPIGGAFVQNQTPAEYNHVAIFAGTTITGGAAMIAVARGWCAGWREKW